MDPRKDIHWIESGGYAESTQLFVEGKVDAFLGFPPQPQELRAKKIGRVIVNTTQDRPWSQYYCCMLAGNREFVRKNPVAAKRALRAYLKAADMCAQFFPVQINFTRFAFVGAEDQAREFGSSRPDQSG